MSGRKIHVLKKPEKSRFFENCEFEVDRLFGRKQVENKEKGSIMKKNSRENGCVTMPMRNWDLLSHGNSFVLLQSWKCYHAYEELKRIDFTHDLSNTYLCIKCYHAYKELNHFVRYDNVVSDFDNASCLTNKALHFLK